MLWIVIITVVLLAVFNPSLLMTTAFWIAAPFLGIWIIIKLVRFIFHSAEVGVSKLRDFSIGDISVDMFNTNHYTYNEGSHNNYNNSTYSTQTSNNSSTRHNDSRRMDDLIELVNEDGFERIVLAAAKYYKKKIAVHCEGYEVFGVVTSQSKLSEWTFRISFDAYSNTYEYSIKTENDDSLIPSKLAKDIQNTIRLLSLDKDN